MGTHVEAVSAAKLASENHATCAANERSARNMIQSGAADVAVEKETGRFWARRGENKGHCPLSV